MKIYWKVERIKLAKVESNGGVNISRKQTFKFSSSKAVINTLKPTGHVMHQQFNIQQLYALPTLYL